MRSHSNTLLIHGTLVLTAAWLACGYAAADAVKLNGPLIDFKDVGGFFQISADSSRVVYVADQDTDNVNELYSVHISGGIVTKLNGALVNNGDVSFLTGDFQISADSNWVVYRADQDSAGNFELYSVPIGGGIVTKLNGAIGIGGKDVDSGFRINADSSRVVYVADQDTLNVLELYSVPIGGGTVTKLNDTLVSGGNAFLFEISVDGSRVVYWADQDTDTVDELYSVPIGGGTVTKLNGALVGNGDVQNIFQISSDGSRVVYMADQDTDEEYELYSVLIGGGTVTKLNGALVNGGDVSAFDIVPDGSRVVYVADQDTDEEDELYSVPIGSGTVTKLNGALVNDGDVFEFAISADGSRLVYRAHQDSNFLLELYSVPIGGGTVTKLNGALVGGGNVQNAFQISADSSRVVYLADQDTDKVWELYGAPIEGGTITKLNGSLVGGGGVFEDFEIVADGSQVVYRADQDTNQIDEIYSVPIEGGTVTKLNGTLVSGGRVIANEFQISTDSGRVVYRADQDTDNIFELYAATLPGAGPPPNPDNVFVDFAFAGPEFGTLSSPFDTLFEGVGAASTDATINLEPGTTSEIFAGPDAIGKALELLNNDPGGGSVIIGQSGARAVQGSAKRSGFISIGRVRE